jgi:predicted DsbA family dithiol-disulfide isomerase
VIQIAVIRELCPYCLVVNCLAMLVAGFATFRAKRGESLTIGKTARWLWAAGASTAFSVGLGIGIAAGWSGSASPSTAPEEVKSHWAPDKINIVEVIDFECPYCRAMHATVRQLVEEEKEHVHYVRLTAPLPAHQNARAASRAFICAQQQDRGADMAEALFSIRDRSTAACEQVAGEMGLSLYTFRSCVASSATDARLDAECAWVLAASPKGLPVVWIQDEMFFGVQPINVLRKAVQTAREHATAGEAVRN